MRTTLLMIPAICAMLAGGCELSSPSTDATDDDEPAMQGEPVLVRRVTPPVLRASASEDAGITSRRDDDDWSYDDPELCLPRPSRLHRN